MTRASSASVARAATLARAGATIRPIMASFWITRPCPLSPWQARQPSNVATRAPSAIWAGSCAASIAGKGIATVRRTRHSLSVKASNTATTISAAPPANMRLIQIMALLSMPFAPATLRSRPHLSSHASFHVGVSVTTARRYPSNGGQRKILRVPPAFLGRSNPPRHRQPKTRRSHSAIPPVSPSLAE